LLSHRSAKVPEPRAASALWHLVVAGESAI
jgi:hypothetical protein